MALWRPYKEMKIGMRRHGRQGAGDWIPASAGMTEWWWLPAIFVAIAHVGCHRYHQS